MFTSTSPQPRKNHTTAQERRELRRKLPAIDERQRYPIQPDALAYLDCSRKTFYEDVKAGRIRLIKVGRRSYVPGSELVRLSQVPAACARRDVHRL